GQYLLFPRFFNIEPDLQHRLATVLGAVSLSGGCVGIGIGLSSRKIANRRKWIALIVGPLGATQVCTGLTLLFWAAGLNTLVLVTTGGALLCMVVFTSMILAPRGE